MPYGKSSPYMRPSTENKQELGSHSYRRPYCTSTTYANAILSAAAALPAHSSTSTAWISTSASICRAKMRAQCPTAPRAVRHSPTSYSTSSLSHTTRCRVSHSMIISSTARCARSSYPGGALSVRATARTAARSRSDSSTMPVRGPAGTAPSTYATSAMPSFRLVVRLFLTFAALCTTTRYTSARNLATGTAAGTNIRLWAHCYNTLIVDAANGIRTRSRNASRMYWSRE